LIRRLPAHFTDQSGFVYLLTLVRKDILKNRVEKHRIKVRYAPSFTSKHDTFIPIINQGVDPRRKKSDVGVSPPERIRCQSSDTLECGDLPLENPILPPCPVPLYYFPKPYPYSQNPCIASSLSRQLTPSNPNLRVRIPDPWAQSVQIFVSEERPETIPTGNPKSSTPSAIHHPNLQELRTRTYAGYIVYTKPGSRHVETLITPGSTFDLAWTMFTKFFKKKTNVDWTNLHEGWKRRIKFEDVLKERVGGEDGAADYRPWSVIEPTLTFGASTGNR